VNRQILNRINQGYIVFIKLVAPLKNLFGISFGYMIVFKDGRYYQITENIKFLQEFSSEVKESCIFCDRNITDYFDGEYQITLWPKIPMTRSMELYYKHNIWNGITVSRISENYTELYWFAGDKEETKLQKFFMKNKPVLLEFIRYFDMHKESLFLPKEDVVQGLFKFTRGFETKLPNSERMQEEVYPVKKLLGSLRSGFISLERSLKCNLSPREVEILSIICRGFTAKAVAQKLSISVKTVQNHLEHIKNKTGLRFKTDLVRFYENFFVKRS
jgi:DNA-binding CsgD family transcriptional regulator